jgi:hypothetical protein
MEEGKCVKCGHKVRRVYTEKVAIPKHPNGTFKEVISRKFEVFHYKKKGLCKYSGLCMYSDYKIGWCKCEAPTMPEVVGLRHVDERLEK